MNKYTITIDNCRDCADCMFARKPMSMGEDDPLYGYFCRAKGFKEKRLIAWVKDRVDEVNIPDWCPKLKGE